jgi:hypothetical protein
MRSINGTNAGVAIRMDNGASFTQNLVRDTTWKWYRISILPDTMKYRVLAANHTFKVIATSARTEIDQYLLTPNAATSLPEGIPGTINPCSTVVVPTITPNDTVSTCTNITLSSSSGLSYLWSNSSTTQSINVSTQGNYIVTVTDINGCTATSLPTYVIISTCPCVKPNTFVASDVYRYSAKLNWQLLTNVTYYTLKVTDTGTGAFQEKVWDGKTKGVKLGSLFPGRTYKAELTTNCGNINAGTLTIFFVTRQ